jgi:hypothetical protein
VGQEYLAPRRLTQELDLIEQLAGREPSEGSDGTGLNRRWAGQ